MTTVEELLKEIFDGNSRTLYVDFEGWVIESRRFKAFATEYRTKIRAKLKNVRDDSAMQDLRAELETAALLLRVDKFTLEYEKYASLKQRGPDFTVTYKTHTPFNVEVRRLWSVELDENPDARQTKLIAVLCDKVGQMPPSIVNLLWLVAENGISEADLMRALVTLRQLADRKMDEFFAWRGYENATAFLRQYTRLSGIVLREADGNTVWLNPAAKHKVQPEVVNAIQRIEVR